MVAEYLASINLSKETWPYPLKTLPRLTGRSNRFIVTEYALPRRLIQPHDVVARRTGHGLVHPFRRAVPRQDGPQDRQGLGISRSPCSSRAIRSARSISASTRPAILGRHDVPGRHRALRQEDRDVQDLVHPEGMADRRGPTGHLEPSFTHVDGKVWVKNSDRSQILRLDLASRTMGKSRLVQATRPAASASASTASAPTATTISICSTSSRRPSASSTPRPASSRSIAARSPIRARAAAWSMARTGCGTPNTPATRSAWSTPRPRRSRNGCCRRRGRSPMTSCVDKNGEAWTGSMMSDRVSRLDPKTGTFVEYQLPKTTNIRRVFVDNSTTPGDVLGRLQPRRLDHQARAAGLDRAYVRHGRRKTHACPVMCGA